MECSCGQRKGLQKTLVTGFEWLIPNRKDSLTLRHDKLTDMHRKISFTPFLHA